MNRVVWFFGRLKSKTSETSPEQVSLAKIVKNRWYKTGNLFFFPAFYEIAYLA